MELASNAPSQTAPGNNHSVNDRQPNTSTMTSVQTLPAMRLSESAVDGDKTPEPQTAEAEPWPRARNDENDDIEGIDRTDVALKQFEVVDKNIYVRSSSDVSKYDESLPCHCRYNPDRDERSQACGESSDCINRLVQMECNPLTCPCGSYCMNRRFQKRQYAKVRIIDAGRKGFGMQALEDLDTGRFVMEYMGEVVTAGEFRKRAGVYQAEGIQHHYFMSIGNNKVIDATRKGCIARYINHSCGPNCVLQKWMVGGAIRMGIFVERPIKRGEEITFDYKFERMADSEPQPCYCGSAECKGIIGVTKERTRKNAPSAAGSDEDVDNVMADIDEEIEDDTVTRHQRDDIRRRHAAFDDEEYGGGDHADRAEMGLSDSETGSDVDDEDENGYHLASRSSGFKRIRRRTKKTGLTSPEQVLKFVQIMHRSARQTRIIEILIGKLMETNDKRLLKSLIGLQGVVILRSWLQDYENDDVMVIKILQCIAHMPISTKNTIEETRLLEAIEPLCRYSDETIAAMAQDLIERWSELKRVFKIPKKSRKESSATGTPASETPSVSRRQSPSRIARQATPLANTSAQGLEGNFANERAGQQNWRNVAGVQQPRMRSESPSMREPYGGYQHPHPNAYGNPNPNRPYYNQTPYGGAGGAGGVSGGPVLTSNGWSHRGRGAAGYHRGQSPTAADAASRMTRSPNRTPYSTAGFRSRYVHPASRSRSPNRLQRNSSYAGPQSRFARNTGGEYATQGPPFQYQNQQQHPRGRYPYRNGQPYTANEQGSEYGGGAAVGGGDKDYGIAAGSATDNVDSAAASAPKLAAGWHTAYTNDGMAYYYHETTKQTQWEPPLAAPFTASQIASPAHAAEAVPGAGAGAGADSSNRSNNLGVAPGQQQLGSNPRNGPLSRSATNSGQHQYGRIHQGSRVPSASSGSVSGDKWTGGSHGLQGEYAATDSPAQNTPDTSTSVYSASKAKVDEIIERAQRLGVVNMQADKPGSKNAASSSDNAMGATTALQLVTPETDNEPTTGASKKQPYPHTTLHTAAPTGSTSSVANVPASNDSTSGLSPHNSPRKITPMSAAKREKLEKKATSELAAFVVRAMSKYKGQLGHDEFKHEARKITKILMEKERKTPPFDPLKLIELSQHKKTKIKQFVADYMNKLVSRRTDAGSPRDTPSEGAAVPKTPPIPPPSASALR